MSYPIYIPSKGRASTCLTAEELRNNGIEFYIVIEPQDFESYSKKFTEKNLLIMSENNRGISYARNFCKNHSISMGDSWHWQLDDNIKNFAIRTGNKNVKVHPGKCFKIVENVTTRFKNVGISGMKHSVFAFAAKDEYGVNQQCYSAVFVNNQFNASWEDGLPEDTDYSLQVLFRGFCTILFNRILINKVTTDKMKGGNTEISYANGGRLKRYQKLKAKYPFFKITQNKNRYKIAPSRIWRTFKQRPSMEIK